MPLMQEPGACALIACALIRGSISLGLRGERAYGEESPVLGAQKLLESETRNKQTKREEETKGRWGGQEHPGEQCWGPEAPPHPAQSQILEGREAVW